MLTSLVSFFVGLKTKHLFALLGLLGLLMSLGLCYKAGRSDGYELAQAEYLESEDRSKDRVIEELQALRQEQSAAILENRQANVNLSRAVRTEINSIETQLKEISNETPATVGDDCRADYAGTIGVFKQLALGHTPGSVD